MIYSNNYYKFCENNVQQDKIPEWMNEQLFDNLQHPKKMVKVANNLFENTTNEHHCKCCNTKLADNEVLFCKHCIQDCLK